MIFVRLQQQKEWKKEKESLAKTSHSFFNWRRDLNKNLYIYENHYKWKKKKWIVEFTFYWLLMIIPPAPETHNISPKRTLARTNLGIIYLFKCTHMIIGKIVLIIHVLCVHTRGKTPHPIIPPHYLTSKMKFCTEKNYLVCLSKLSNIGC